MKGSVAYYASGVGRIVLFEVEHLLPSSCEDCGSCLGRKSENTWLIKRLGKPTTKSSPGSPLPNTPHPTPLREEAWVIESGTFRTGAENPRWPQESGSASIKKVLGNLGWPARPLWCNVCQVRRLKLVAPLPSGKLINNSAWQKKRKLPHPHPCSLTLLLSALASPQGAWG